EVDSDDNYVISDADAGDFCTIKVKVYPSITKEYLESLNLYYANQPSKGLRKLGVSRDAVHVDWLTDEVIDWFEDYVIQKSKAHMLYPDNQSEYTINKAARLRSMPDIFGELTALQAAEILYEDILREFGSYSTKRPYTIAGYDKLVMSAERWGDYWEVRDYTEYKFNGTRPGMELLFYGAVLTKTNGIWYLDTAQKGGGDIALAQPVSLSGRYDTATLTRNVYKTKDYTNSAHEELRPVGVRVWDKDYTFQLTDRYDVDALLDIVCDTAPDRDDADILNAAYSNNSRDFVHIQVVLDGSQGGAEFTLVYASPYTEIRGWENRTLIHALGIKHDEGIIWLTDRAIDRFEEICGRNGINADNFLFCDNQLRGNFAEEQFILGLSDPNGDYEPMQAAERLYRIMVDICSESDPKRTYVITEIKELKLGIEEYGDTSRVYDYGTVLEFDGVLSSVHNGGFIVDMGGYFDYIDGVWYLSTYYGFEAFLDQATVF
ncbi:MAG: hypothetical protein IKY46_01070, partial [Clostridia bacterium]|nr:hypothetical protein [Clostridia bacterium]